MAEQHHRRSTYNRSFHLHAGPERARHAHTVHEPKLIERTKGPSGSRLRHRLRPSNVQVASARRRNHDGVPVQRDLRVPLRRRRALLFNGARDERRSFNGDRPEGSSGPRFGRGRAAVKGAATARAFARPLLGFSQKQRITPSVHATSRSRSVGRLFKRGALRLPREG